MRRWPSHVDRLRDLLAVDQGDHLLAGPQLFDRQFSIRGPDHGAAGVADGLDRVTVDDGKGVRRARLQVHVVHREHGGGALVAPSARGLPYRASPYRRRRSSAPGMTNSSPRATLVMVWVVVLFVVVPSISITPVLRAVGPVLPNVKVRAGLAPTVGAPSVRWPPLPIPETFIVSAGAKKSLMLVVTMNVPPALTSTARGEC